MSVTNYILRENGEKVMYDGPCRCPSREAIDDMCRYISERCEELAPCNITIRDLVYGDTGEHTVPGSRELYYDPAIDSQTKLTIFMEHLKPHYFDHILNIYVTDQSGNTTDFEFEDMDL